MEDKEIVITYETLFELLRREKDREALQKLNDSFFDDVVSYLNEKKKALHETDASLLNEREKIEKQIQNIKKLLKEIYEKRERKLLNLAIDKVRTNALIDMSALLKEEDQLFGLISSILNDGRERILNHILEGKGPAKLEEKKEAAIVVAEAGKEEGRETRLVRFLHAVPRFLGKELEEYGPFEEEDVASLPTEIVNILINKGRAEEINEY